MQITPKKMITSLLVAMTITGGAALANGIDNPSSASGVAVVKNGTTFKLYYKSEQHSTVKVSIIDESNKVIYTETLRNTDGFVRPYNIEDLQAGQYTVQVSDKSGIQTQKLTIQGEKKTDLAHLFKVSGEEGKYLLTMYNQPTGKIKIKIYDNADNLIYNETEEAAGAEFAKIYNLKKYSGKITFEVTDSTGRSNSITN